MSSELVEDAVHIQRQGNRRENLEEDLIKAEVKSLRRRAEITEKLDELEQDIIIPRRKVVTTEHHRLSSTEECDLLEAKRQSDQRYIDVCLERDSLRSELEGLGAELSYIKEKSQTEVEEWKKNYHSIQSSLQSEIDRLRRELTDAQQEAQLHLNATHRIKDLMAQLEKSSRLNAEFQEELNISRSDAAKLRADNMTLIQKTDEQERLLHRLQTDLTEAQQQAEQLDLDHHSKAEDMRSIRTEKVELLQENDKFKRTVESLQNELQLAVASHNSMKATIKEEREVSRNLRGELKNVQKQLSKCQDKLQQASIERDAANTAIDDANKHNQTLQEQVAGFREKLEGTAKRLEGLKRQRDSNLKHENDLIRILSRVDDHVSQANAHASRCAAKGHLAMKAKRIAEDANIIFEQVIDYLAESKGAFKTRRDVLQAIKEHQTQNQR